MRVLDAARPRMNALMAELGFPVMHLFIHGDKPTLYRFCERLGFREVERKRAFILMQQEVIYGSDRRGTR